MAQLNTLYITPGLQSVYVVYGRFLVLLLAIALVSCSESRTVLQEEPVHGLPSDTLTQDYTHVYDTLKHSQYAYWPDSLYELLVHADRLTQADAGAYQQMAASPQGKCFLAKMRDMRKNKPLVQQLGLPHDAQIFEWQSLPQTTDRMLVLWLKAPYVSIDLLETYTCPEYTQGKAYFEGEAYLSLVNTRSNKVVNTIPFGFPPYSYEDTIASTIHHRCVWDNPIPISALQREQTGGAMSGKYFTRQSTDTTDGPVTILHLEDFNRDGRAYEFGAFKNYACAGTSCSLFGYSVVQDRAIRYPIHARIHEHVWKDTIPTGDTTYLEETYVIDALFAKPPTRYPYSYAVDYRGRGGNYMRYQVAYDSLQEAFLVEVDATIHPGDEKLGSSWMPSME